MKRLSILCYILVALFVVVACDDSDNKEETTIIVTTPTEVTLGRYATEFELRYEAETAVDIALSDSWLRVGSHSTGRAMIEVEENDTGGSRMAAITLSYGGGGATVVVTQLGEALEAVIEITSGEVIDVERMGTKIEIEYQLENRNPKDYVYVKSAADWIHSIDTDTDGVVELGIATNTTKQSRQTTITIGYGTATAEVILHQAGEGEIIFRAPVLWGDYLGDALTPGVGNYWFFLSDRGFDPAGDSLPNTTYYRIDAYGPPATDLINITIPNGTYHYDTENTYNEWTFTAEYSGFWVTDAEARRGDIAPFESGVLTVEDDKITLNVWIDGEEHTAIYEGEISLVDSRDDIVVYSTLDGDYEADLSDHYMVYACEGDYYDFGRYNWMFLLLPNSGVGDCFQFDIITGYGDKESGFYGDYTASDYLAEWSFIPGWTNMAQLLCSWYFTVDQNEMAPLRGGEMSVTDNGDGTLTVDIAAYDDLRHKITGRWTGVAQEYKQEYK